MSLTLLNQKFEALRIRELQIEQYYDPIGHHAKQHRNIEDLRQDYQEDLENYGFTKQSLRVKESEPLEFRTRPMTAAQSSSPQFISPKLQRPVTSPGFNVRVASMMKIEENDEIVATAYATNNKYWRNTKKYDITNQNQIRNHSALKKINIGNTDHDEYNIEQEEAKNSTAIETKIIQNKLFTLTGKPASHFKSDKDIRSLTNGFIEHLSMFKQPKISRFQLSSIEPDQRLSDIMHLIQSANSPVVFKVKQQGLRPQTAIQRKNRPMTAKPFK